MRLPARVATVILLSTTAVSGGVNGAATDAHRGDPVAPAGVAHRDVANHGVAHRGVAHRDVVNHGVANRGVAHRDVAHHGVDDLSRRAARAALPPGAQDTARLRRALAGITANFAGIVGISVRNLSTGESVAIRGHEKYPSASLIKVPILVALLAEVESGRMDLGERSTLIARDRVGGSGILKHMASGTDPTLADLAWLMITLSDNTATNLVLDKLDIATVGAKMEALGLPESKVHSKTFRRQTSIAMDSSALYGLGVTTPDEMVALFAMLHDGRAVSPAQDSIAMRMLHGNQDGNMMVRWLPSGTPVAHKSGSVDQARNDCGIMVTPAAPIALCVMTRENEDRTYAVDNSAHLLIARIARQVYRHYNPDVPLPDLPAFDAR